MANSCNHTKASTEERLDAMEQALLRVTKQMQTLTQSIGQLRAPHPTPQIRPSGTQKGIDGQPIEIKETQLKLDSNELKGNLRLEPKKWK